MANTKKILKKTARKQIEQKLKTTLATLEPVFGNKDFRQRIKKVSKALTNGLKIKTSQQALGELRKIHLEKKDSVHVKKNGADLSSQTVTTRKRKPLHVPANPAT